MLTPPPHGYSTCPRCEQRQTPGTGCTDGDWPGGAPPIRFGSEAFYAGQSTCRDCGAPVGGTHHYDCSIEYCPHRRQAITCELCVPLETDPYERAPRVD